MKSKYRSKAAHEVIERVDTAEQKTEDLEEIVFGGKNLSPETILSQTTKDIKQVERQMKETIAERYGTMIGNVLVILDGLGVYNVRNLVKKDLKKLEKKYANLDTIVARYRTKRNEIIEKMDNAEGIKVKAGILLNRYENMVEDMYQKKTDLEDELKAAKTAAAENPENTTYITLQGEINALKSDIRKVENQADKSSAKVISYNTLSKIYNNEKIKVDQVLDKGEDALIVTEDKIVRLKALQEAGISPIDVVKGMASIYKGCSKAEKVTDKIDGYSSKVVHILDRMPQYQMSGGNGNDIIKDMEDNLAMKNDERRKKAHEILMNDLRV